MKAPRVWVAAPLLAAVLCAPGALTRAYGDGPKARARAGKADLGAAVARAVKRAKEDSVTDSPMARVTACPNEGPLLVVVEFEDGGVGFFSGGEDPKDDNFALADPKNLDLLREALTRATSRVSAQTAK